MIYSLRGIVRRLALPFLTIDVQGTGYLVAVPVPVWESAVEGLESTLITYTYVREDRLELFGFAEENDRMLFAEFLNLSGIGPKIALELCSIPKITIQRALDANDPKMLTHIRGIGTKIAEKLLLDLKSVRDKHPHLWTSTETAGARGNVDMDALAALISLGYQQNSAMEALQELPPEIIRTEERVTAVLRAHS